MKFLHFCTGYYYRYTGKIKIALSSTMKSNSILSDSKQNNQATNRNPLKQPKEYIYRERENFTRKRGQNHCVIDVENL